MDGIRRRGKVRNKSWHVYLLVVSWFLIPAVAHLDSCSPITLTHLEFHWEGWEYFHSRVIAKTSPLDFSPSFFFFLFHSLATPFSHSALHSCPPGPSRCPSSFFPLLFIAEHCFGVPGSAFLCQAYQPACRSVCRRNSWPMIIHSCFI